MVKNYTTTSNVYSLHLRAYGVTGFQLLHCEVERAFRCVCCTWNRLLLCFCEGQGRMSGASQMNEDKRKSTALYGSASLCSGFSFGCKFFIYTSRACTGVECLAG